MKTATQAPSAPRRARRALLVSSAAGAAGTAFCSALLLAAPAAHAGMVTDQHGNVGYDTAQECDAAVLAGKPYVWGSIYRFEGQVSVFWEDAPDSPSGEKQGLNYRDLYPEPPPPGMVPS